MINTREIAEEYRLAHWAHVIQERTQKGMSIKAFCKHVGIGENTYFYWQRRVRMAAAEIMQGKDILPLTTSAVGEQPKTAFVSDATRIALPTPIPAGWAQAQTEIEPKGIAAAGLPVEIGKYRIMVHEDTDSALLEKVCRVLGALC
jgi:hypothetical protein